MNAIIELEFPLLRLYIEFMQKHREIGAVRFAMERGEFISKLPQTWTQMWNNIARLRFNVGKTMVRIGRFLK